MWFIELRMWWNFEQHVSEMMLHTSRRPKHFRSCTYLLAITSLRKKPTDPWLALIDCGLVVRGERSEQQLSSWRISPKEFKSTDYRKQWYIEAKAVATCVFFSARYVIVYKVTPWLSWRVMLTWPHRVSCSLLDVATLPSCVRREACNCCW